MSYPYITKAHIEGRLGARLVQRVLDDNNDGTADTDAVTQVIADASARVAAKLRGAYDLNAVAANTPAEVVRLTLDVAVAYLAIRHPEVMQRDGESLWKMASTELNELRTGKSSLDTETTPEPGALHGGEVYTGDEDNPDVEVSHTFLNGTGSF